MKKIVILTSLFLLSDLTLAQNTWTTNKIMQYKNITDTNISPDGKHVAYVISIPVIQGEKSEYNSQIWVAATDGSFEAQYTRGEKSSTSPQFSPDGKQIAFLTNRMGDKNQVFIMRLMGGEAEQVTDVKTGVASFKWSPDGKRIAYLMKDPDTAEEEKMKKEKNDVILVDKNYKYNHLYTITVAPDKAGKRNTKQLTSGM